MTLKIEGRIETLSLLSFVYRNVKIVLDVPITHIIKNVCDYYQSKKLIDTNDERCWINFFETNKRSYMEMIFRK